MFSLCRTCTENYQQSPCEHRDTERAITGTWVTDELKEALTQGYKMYEIWNFNDIAQYDPHTKTGILFTEYINIFLKVKQEASGWPDWCTTKEAKQRYIKVYYNTEGILLNYNKIRNNPGLQSLA